MAVVNYMCTFVILVRVLYIKVNQDRSIQALYGPQFSFAFND